MNISTNLNSKSIWSCPNRPTLPEFDGGGWGIGYQYYGGVTAWWNDYAPSGIASASPVKTSKSKAGWMLAADLVMKFDMGSGFVWGDSTLPASSAFVALPAHKKKGNLPAGGNEVFADGSARWFKSGNMMYLSTWTPNARQLYFYQDDLGEMGQYRNSLTHVP